jgi:hypothetical protein
VVHTNNVVIHIYIKIKEIDLRFYKEASTSGSGLSQQIPTASN